MSKKEPEIKPRRKAMIGNVLAIQVEPGTKIFHSATGDLLGVVGDRMPVVNPENKAVYLSTDDWFAARAALPKPEKKPAILPGLPGGKTLH